MRYMRSILFCLAVSSTLSQAAAAGETVTRSLTARDLEARGQLTNLKHFPGDSAIRLDDMLLVEDDAPGNGPPEGFDAKERAWFEKLHEGVRIRKELVLDDPRAFAGYLLMNGVERENNEHPLHIGLNGVEFERPPTKFARPRAEHYYLVNENNYFTDNWFVIEIPAGALKAGTNVFELWTESEEPSWEVVVAAAQEFARGSEIRTEHPNRSAKSRDGGRTWDDGRLGWKDALDGEYAIRLSLDRYVPEGVYVSPVIDIAVESDAPGIKRLLAVKECRIDWDMEIPAETSAAVSVRFGDTPVPGADGWSLYEAVDGLSGAWRNPRGRYLQFRVAMKTANPLSSPSLEGMTITAVTESRSPASNAAVHLVDLKNGRVIRPSIPFTHEDFTKLADFRRRFKLDELTADAATEFEKQLRLLRFAYEIPIDRFDPYDWDYNKVPVLTLDENGNILRQTNYTGRRRDKHCLFSNFTLMGACLAMGYPARYVNLQTEGRMHAHEVMEVWSNDFDKWVFLDATRDYYFYDPDTGVPLSLTEINGRLAPLVPRTADWYDPIWKQIPDFSVLLGADIGWREGDNAFSIRDAAHGPHLLLLMGQLHMVVRSDFASRPGLVPWRLSGHWAGNQFMGWYREGVFPRKREYGMNTSRPQDFNPTLNQAELTLSETDRPGVLRVDVDTETPCFDAFMVKLDGSEWYAVKASSFDWPLHEGLNTIRVRTRNTVGVMGPESVGRVVVNR